MTEQNAEKFSYQEQLKAIREQSGLSTHRFVAKMNVDPKLIETLESGEHRPTVYPAFYRALRRNDVSEDEVEKLLNSDGAPEELLSDEEASKPIVTLMWGKLKVIIYADKDQFKPEDFDLNTILKLRNSLRRSTLRKMHQNKKTQ